MIPFGSWAPDLPDFQNPGATEAKNVFPDFAGYRPIPLPILQDVATGAPATAVLGAFYSETVPAGAESGGNQFIYVGVLAKLHTLKLDPSAPAWTDVTRTVGGAYTGTRWRFVKFGTRVIAVNGADDPQSYVEGTSTNFAALAGSPPTDSAVVAVVRDFVAMAPVGNTLHWSAINNPIDWTPSATTQSDTQVIPEGGFITGIAGGEYGLVFMERSIYRMTYIGSPLIFQFDRISTNVGMRSDASLAQYESLCFFYSGSGFYMLAGGQQLTPIGDGKVDRFFYAEDTDRASNRRIKAACVDPMRMLYCVYYEIDEDGGEGRALFYHWPTGRWARAVLLESGGGNSLEFMSVAAGIYFDNGNESTGELVLSPVTLIGFNTSHRCVIFGPDTTLGGYVATLETTEAQIFPGRRAFVQGIRPLVDGGTDANITVAVAARSAPNDTVTFATAVAMNSSGLSPQRSSGRFHRARVSIAAGAVWTHAQGVDVEAVPEGTR